MATIQELTQQVQDQRRAGLAELAQLIEDQQHARLTAQYGASEIWDNQKAVIQKPGRTYTMIDYAKAGKFMVENTTGKIFGIKGYGRVHRGHQYGTLETINDWYWGEFYPRNPIELEA